MKELVQHCIDSHADEMIQFGNELFETPELGFKEKKTKEKIVHFLKQLQISVEKEYAETGFQITLGHGKPHIGLIAELDAIVTPHHRCANNSDQAAHSCAHSTQVTIMLNAVRALKEIGLFEKKQGTVTLFFTPAEEFVDLAYRRSLIQEGRIRYLSGKENMLADHHFDGIDCIIHLHAMGTTPGIRYNVNSQLAGFVYKIFRFQGKGAHAAVLPHEGINALNEFTLFQSAVAMLRETFKEEEKTRIHGMITHGGDSVNTIPQEVVYEGYVRSFDPHRLLELSTQLTHTARCCAQALGGDCQVENIPGYLPFQQNQALSEIVYRNMLHFVNADQIMTAEQSVAAGDIGDVGCFFPTIQFGYSGFSGTIHGSNLEIDDPQAVYIEPAKIVAMSVIDLIEDPSLVKQICASFQPTMSREAYLNYLDQK